LDKVEHNEGLSVGEVPDSNIPIRDLSSTWKIKILDVFLTFVMISALTVFR